MPRLQHENFLKKGSDCLIEFDGERIDAIAGESIAAALTAAGRLAIKRDKGGATRGIFCGMGACFECQVSIDSGPAQRACLTKVQPGMKIRSLAYRARIPPAGNNAEQRQSLALECDVLIVGAGPAGMSAAVQLAEAGVSIIVVDERQEPGGQFFKQVASSYQFAGDKPSDSQYREGAAQIDRLLKADAQVISGATVWGAFREDSDKTEICVSAGMKSYVVSARQLVLATGAFESVPAFPGWTLPGVMTTGAAQGLVRAYRVAPGQRVLIAGNGPLNVHLAYELVNCGIDVVAVAESAPAPLPRHLPAAIGALISAPNLIRRGMGYLRTLRNQGVPVHYGHHILCADGEGRVRSGTIAKIGRDAKTVPDTEKIFDVDAVCVGYALHPSNELAKLLGCKHAVVASSGVAPIRDESGQTNIAGVFMVGDGGVLGGADVAMAEGRLAARAILENLSGVCSKPDRHDRKALHRHRKFQRNLWSMYAAPDFRPALPDTPVCRCEMVTLGTIESLIEGGVRDMAGLKRLSRAGMGLCQGRYCQKQIATILADKTGNNSETEELFAPQLPIKLTLAANVAAEKPEWYGYRAVELPEATRKPNVAISSVEETDVLIIGAGVIGIATALFLAREGVDVLIVDRNLANGQASGGNAGSLHLQLMSFDFFDEPGAGRSPAASALSLQKMGINAWRDLEQELDADIELDITGGIMVAENSDDLEFLRKKASLETSSGIETEILSEGDLRDMAPTVSGDMVGAAYCADEGKINPLLATPLLLNEAIGRGARIRENTTVIDIGYKNGKFTVTTNAGQISCRKIVNAAGGWTGNIASMIGVTLPVKSAPQQMIVTEPVDPLVNHLIALAKRHLTMKQVANGNIIIGGGWSAGYQSESNRAVTLRDSIEGNLWVAQRVIPQIGQLQVIRSWATIGVMIDGAPILGELPGHPGFFNAVGANGYTMGPAIGRITAELVRSGPSIADIRPFSVDRFN
jgi:glycine/D-amino acid oxidase-like deaminating enzyme